MHHWMFSSVLFATCFADAAGGTLLQRCFQDAKKLVDDAYMYSRQE